MKKPDYRISIFWEETGTMEEGTMRECRDLALKKKPTKRDMNKIEGALLEVLKKLKLVKPKDG